MDDNHSEDNHFFDVAVLLNEELGTELPENSSLEKLRLSLAEWINGLLQHDFQRLISILYRVDVNEDKLKFFLREKVGEDAAQIMSDLIIEREIQKWESRKAYQQAAAFREQPGAKSPTPETDDEAEKW